MPVVHGAGAPPTEPAEQAAADPGPRPAFAARVDSAATAGQASASPLGRGPRCGSTTGSAPFDVAQGALSGSRKATREPSREPAIAIRKTGQREDAGPGCGAARKGVRPLRTHRHPPSSRARRARTHAEVTHANVGTTRSTAARRLPLGRHSLRGSHGDVAGLRWMSGARATSIFVNQGAALFRQGGGSSRSTSTARPRTIPLSLPHDCAAPARLSVQGPAAAWHRCSPQSAQGAHCGRQDP